VAAASLTLWTLDQDERTEAVCLATLAGLTG
jgi:hypothetical protein